MARLTAEEKRKLEEKIQETDEDVYGTGHMEGDHEKFSDTEDMVEEAIGNKPGHDKKGFNIGDEVNDDEDARHSMPADDDDDDENEDDDDDEAGNKKGLDLEEDAATMTDPYEGVKDKDIK